MGVETARLYARRNCLTCFHFLPASLEPPYRGYCRLLKMSVERPRDKCPHYMPSITTIVPAPELPIERREEKEEKREGLPI